MLSSLTLLGCTDPNRWARSVSADRVLARCDRSTLNTDRLQIQFLVPQRPRASCYFYIKMSTISSTQWGVHILNVGEREHWCWIWNRCWCMQKHYSEQVKNDHLLYATFSPQHPAASKSRLCCTYPHTLIHTNVYIWPKTNFPGGPPQPWCRIPKYHINILPVLICVYGTESESFIQFVSAELRLLQGMRYWFSDLISHKRPQFMFI